jgi:F0F1-type ATP synthase delta subunit
MKKRELMHTVRALLVAMSAVPEKERALAARTFIGELQRQHKIVEPTAFMRAIEQVWSDVFGPKTVSLTTAYRVPVALKEKIAETLPAAEVKSVIDPRLIGGATLRLDDRIIDSSVLGTLERMKKALLAH